MNLLLDTHIFIWLNDAPEKLTPAIREACEDPSNGLFLSVASVWEIQIKQQLGKLELEVPWFDMVETQRKDNGLIVLPIELRHIQALANLPAPHRDPFDRLIIAQAIHETMTLASMDAIFSEYPARLIS
ncbi:MAG: type II toxin-antitoxin system VapC family toxin [Candidatus Methylumidiphilus sp.]